MIITSTKHNIKDISLAPYGKKKIDWVRSSMPVLSSIEKRFEREKPFEGRRIAISIHLEAKTANLALTLRAGGAEVYVTGCNPLSTQDDVAAALADYGFPVFARRGVGEEEYTEHLMSVLSCEPHVILDDGGDLTNLLHGTASGYMRSLAGGTEETTTGVNRLIAREKDGKLLFPMMDVNNADCKHLFDNRYGTGQSTWDAIMHTTNRLVTGKTVVVAGYGYCGRGIAARARGMGADVIVTEVNPVKAIEAAMDGFRVMTMDRAAPLGDIFVTVTGCHNVIVGRHFEVMKDEVLLCNAGHFDVEVSKPDLKALSTEIIERRDSIQGYRMKDGRILNLLAEGRLVNLAAGNGHPSEIMDMSFSLQALCLEYMLKNGASMKPGVYKVPAEIDRAVAHAKLAAMGIAIDTLTPEQEKYLNSY